MKKLLSANPVMVKSLVDYLVDAYEQFIKETEGVSYVDGFMAVHNFHCLIIQHLEQEGGFDTDTTLFFRQMAKDTFEKRLLEMPLP